VVGSRVRHFPSPLQLHREDMVVGERGRHSSHQLGQVGGGIPDC
jgi:hypothetical protein